MRIEQIIWATDGSAAADRALPYAKSLAKERDGELVVVHCTETHAAHRAHGRPVQFDEEDLTSKVERQVGELKQEGLAVRATIVTAAAGARAAHAIADIAREVGADVIVAGTRGHTAVGGIVLGSVTHRLLQIAPCAVLAVPWSSHAAEPEADPSHAAGHAA